MNSNLAVCTFFRKKSIHSLCSSWYRKRVGWIWCKFNRNLERNESCRRIDSIGKKYLVARSFSDDDTYSLHRYGVGVCIIELEFCSV